MNTTEQIFSVIDSERLRTISKFRVGKEAEAFQSLTQYINYIQSGVDGVFRFFEPSLFSKTLEEIFGAQQNCDYVRVADLLQYELPAYGLDPSSVNITEICLTATTQDDLEPGVSITFSANACGGTGLYEFCYLLAIGDNDWSVVRDFTKMNSFEWTVPPNVDAFSMGVWIRCIGCEEDLSGIKMLEFSTKNA